MRSALALILPALLGGAGCIAAEPGRGKDTETSPRKACTELEGLTFVGGPGNGESVTFATDDAEYSTYTETAPDGTQSIGLAQCDSVGLTNLIFIDGATDRHGARADLPNSASGMFLTWSDGQTLVAFIDPL
ncbi:MAG: hypothetical protein ACKV2T_25070 [Kofleriaceae bacterium]